MQKKQLGNSEMHISPLGVGAWAMGGADWAYSWGEQDEKESVAAIHKALEQGINWIDTAPVYGYGKSEEVVSRAVKAWSGEKPYIFTKCAMVWNDKGEVSNSLKADSIRKECEDSLKRLNIDQIDLYQLHWPTPDADIEEAWTTLAELREQGKAKEIGVSNFDVKQMDRIRKIAPITSLQPPFSVLRPKISWELFPYCREHNIGIIGYSPLLSGMLTGKMTAERAANLPKADWRSRNPEFREPKLSQNLALVEKLQTLANRNERTVPEVALAWVLDYTDVTGAIVGMRSPQQAEEVSGALDFRLSIPEKQELDEFVRSRITGYPTAPDAQ